MRPKSIGGSGSTMKSPTLDVRLDLLRLRQRRAASPRSRRSPPPRGSASGGSRRSCGRSAARMSFSCPYLERPAFWIACSIASSTSSRSMPFSRATASATCSSSSLGNSDRSMSHTSFSSCDLASRFARRSGDQLVGQHQLGALNRRRRAPSTRPRRVAIMHLVARHARAACRGSAGGRRSACAISIRASMAGEAVEIRRPGQRPVDAGRADLERVGAGDRILDIEHGRDGAADVGAIVDRVMPCRSARSAMICSVDGARRPISCTRTSS